MLLSVLLSLTSFAGQDHNYLQFGSHGSVAYSAAGDGYAVFSAVEGFGGVNHGLVLAEGNYVDGWDVSDTLPKPPGSDSAGTIAINPLTDLPALVYNEADEYFYCVFDVVNRWGNPCESIAPPVGGTAQPDLVEGRDIPKLVFLSDGTPMVMHRDPSVSALSVYTRDPLGAWTQELITPPLIPFVIIGPGPGGPTIGPLAFDVVTDDLGGAHAVWTETATPRGEADLAYAYFDGVTWSPTEYINTARGVSDVSIDVDSTGVVSMAFMRSDRNVVVSTTDALGDFNDDLVGYRMRNERTKVAFVYDRDDLPHIAVAGTRDPFGDCVANPGPNGTHAGTEIQYGVKTRTWHKYGVWNGGGAPTIDLAADPLRGYTSLMNSMSFNWNSMYMTNNYASSVRMDVQMLTRSVEPGGTMAVEISVHNHTPFTEVVEVFGEATGSCSSPQRPYTGIDVIRSMNVPAFGSRRRVVTRQVPLNFNAGTWSFTWYLNEARGGSYDTVLTQLEVQP